MSTESESESFNCFIRKKAHVRRYRWFGPFDWFDRSSIRCYTRDIHNFQSKPVHCLWCNRKRKSATLHRYKSYYQCCNQSAPVLTLESTHYFLFSSYIRERSWRRKPNKLRTCSGFLWAGSFLWKKLNLDWVEWVNKFQTCNRSRLVAVDRLPSWLAAWTLASISCSLFQAGWVPSASIPSLYTTCQNLPFRRACNFHFSSRCVTRYRSRFSRSYPRPFSLQFWLRKSCGLIAENTPNLAKYWRYATSTYLKLDKLVPIFVTIPLLTRWSRRTFDIARDLALPNHQSENR